MSVDLQDPRCETVALWYNSNQPQEREGAKKGCMRALLAFAQEMNCDMGPVEYRGVPPYNHGLEQVGIRLVDPPKAMMIPGLRCMIASCLMSQRSQGVVSEVNAFTQELDPKDLEQLRQITRRAYKIHFPHETDPTDNEIDRFITEMGPEVAEERLCAGKEY